MDGDDKETAALLKNDQDDGQVCINMEDLTNPIKSDDSQTTETTNSDLQPTQNKTHEPVERKPKQEFKHQESIIEDDDDDSNKIITFIMKRSNRSVHVKEDSVETVIKNYMNGLTEDKEKKEKCNNETNLLHVICKYLHDSEEVTDLVAKYFSDNKLLHNIDEKGMEPLHVAAHHLNKTALKVVLKYIVPENRNRLWKGDTAYGCLMKGVCKDDEPIKNTYKTICSKFLADHESTFSNLITFGAHSRNQPDCFLCIEEGDMNFSKYKKYRDHNDFVECLKLLLDFKVDVNKVNFEEKSPIYIAAEYGYKHAVKMILENTNQKVDIVTEQGDLKSAKKLIKENRLYSVKMLLSFDYEHEMPLVEHLFQCIRFNDEKKFLKIWSDKSGEDKIYADEDDQSGTLLQHAFEKDQKKIVQKLIEAGANPNNTIPQNFHEPLLTAFRTNNHAMLKIMVNGDEVEIPKWILHRPIYKLCQQDDTCRHTVKSIEIVLKSKNYKSINEPYEGTNNYMPLYYASHNEEIATMLLEHGALLTTSNLDGETDFEVIKHLDIATLRNYFNSCIKKDSCERSEKKSLFGSTKDNLFASQLKLGKKDVNTDVAVMDFSPLLPQGKSNIPDKRQEMDVVQFISDSEKLSPLLSHPLISSFLFMKWHILRWFFFTNVLIFIGFNVSLYFYIFHNSQSDEHHTLIWKIILLIFVGMLTLKEVIEIFILGIEYFFSENEAGKRSLAYLDLENVFEISLVILTYFILFVVDTKFINFGDETVKIFYVFIVLLTSVALLFELEQMPFVNQKVAMLKKVAGNIASTFNLFVIFFIPFALSFTILNQFRETDEPETNFFRSVFTSMFKTVVMMTGEYDMKDSMDFKKYTVASILLFFLFVFFVAIICFNLLIGLAVSDTQEIVNDGERLSLRARTHHICYVQSLLESYKCREKLSFRNKYKTSVKVNYFDSGKITNDREESPINPVCNFLSDKLNAFLDFLGINILNFRELGDKIASEVKIIIDESKKANIHLEEREEELDDRKEGLGILQKSKILKKQ